MPSVFYFFSCLIMLRFRVLTNVYGQNERCFITPCFVYKHPHLGKSAEPPSTALMTACSVVLDTITFNALNHSKDITQTFPPRM